MRTIRRLYFYIVTLISLEVVVWGVINLLRSIFSSGLVDASDVLAQALALVLVGVPIFLFHWLWTQRAAINDEEEERTASLRAIFFYAVLIGTLVPVVQNLLAFVNRVALGVSDIAVSRALVGGSQSWQDNLIAIFINGVVGFYFFNTLRAEWKSLPEIENFADVRRLYRYLWLLYGLSMVVYGAQQILRFIFYIPVPTNLLGEVGREMFVNGLALLLIGTPLWVYAWRICQDALSVSAEKESNLRLGVLYLLSLGGVITVLSAGGTLLDVVLSWALGEAMKGYEFVQQIGGPISLGIPLAGVWAYYGGWLNQQIQSDENLTRRAGKKRLYYYILSALGLGAAFIGIALVFTFVIDLVTSNAFWGESLRSRLAAAISTLVVGLPLWLLTWRPMQAEALAEGDAGDHARRSTIRRAYLYLALFAGVIGGMVAAVGLVYLLVDALLSGDRFADSLSEILNAAQLLALFAILLVYHLNSMRRDGDKTGQTLEERQRGFPVLVIDPEDETFVKQIKAAMAKHAEDVPVVVKSVSESLETENTKAVILPLTLALEPPDVLRKWLKDFSGEKIVVGRAGSGWVLSALTPEQAARSARQVAEGEEVRLARPSAAWNVVQIVAVIIVGIQVLFFLFAIGMSLLRL
ncbi:MAG: DUF5671 domain-containing protein [Anaerolineales bacterium]|jgi:hypothetical protein